MTNATEGLPESITAACVQFDVRRGDVAANLRAVQDGIAEAAEDGARLIALPELWSTSFMPAYDEAVLRAATDAEAKLQELSRKHGAVLVGSSPEAADGAVYNCARVYDCGALLGSYRKLHMFSVNAEHRHHRPGEEPLALDTSIGRLGVMIGYDLRFPELARWYFRQHVDVLAVPAQWPEARSQHWRTLLRARAIENICFVVGANRTGQEPSLKSEEQLSFLGDGRIVDPTGEILASGSGDAGAMTAELQLRTVRTMRRILPVERDERPDVYRRLWERSLEARAADPAAHDGDREG